jgi:hypothetical protein
MEGGNTKNEKEEKREIVAEGMSYNPVGAEFSKIGVENIYLMQHT